MRMFAASCHFNSKLISMSKSRITVQLDGAEKNYFDFRGTPLMHTINLFLYFLYTKQIRKIIFSEKEDDDTIKIFFFEFYL